jgi:uncharacterized alkaline shock family protein YloU
MTITEPARATALRGRTKIAPRALDRVVSAVTADALGVTVKTIDVDLEDNGGSLSLIVTTPIRVPSLDRILRDADVVTRTGGSVLGRARVAQETIRTRVQSLTGSTVDRVVVTITGIDIKQERRVK